ncbi:cytochrome P450 [Deinococcus yavapaiensis]|uniref:Cytochrome P450 n=1 Tax=Deinococcus yavapaiensis KR-236 TaxID=694435 RepID=A0A318S733_9DEIO|nr:cytochrome P450 [Deinococcus yavapaiensis]PYE53585.1 cytochrome P450 [Deinococcus yavapaiensis KR-236]
MHTLPQPTPHPRAGHLPKWGGEPIALLQEGAALGKLFGLNLGLQAIVGYGPSWNKRVLTDLETFVSAGSFSRLVPYLAGGIILTDAPTHKDRRALLNPGFTPKALEALRERVRAALHATRPSGEFDALAWADEAVLAMLNAAYFTSEFPRDLLHAFLAPLRSPFPTPMWPRPVAARRVKRELAELAAKRRLLGGDDLLAFLAPLQRGEEEARISLAAAHDTTTHTLAWATWHLACFPRWRTREALKLVVKETLRLYPAGFMGSRRVAKASEFEGVHLKKGALALYSPFLTHRDPDVWPNPQGFDPERFSGAIPAWSYLPFGGGERTCLGMHLAHLLLEEALSLFVHGDLEARWGDPTPRPGVTLGPAGPLVVRFRT